MLSFFSLTDFRYKGAEDGVKLLLERDADVSATDAKGRTPLDWASYHLYSFCYTILYLILRGYLGDMAVAKLLIAKGAKATCYDCEGFTPFHKAVLNGHLEIMHLLIDAGADVNAKSINNTTALQLALKTNRI